MHRNKFRKSQTLFTYTKQNTGVMFVDTRETKQNKMRMKSQHGTITSTDPVTLSIKPKHNREFQVRDANLETPC